MIFAPNCSPREQANKQASNKGRERKGKERLGHSWATRRKVARAGRENI